MNVLVVEEGWFSTLRVVRALREIHEVTVLTANGMTATCQCKGVRWCCGPAIGDARFITHVDAMMAASAFDRVLPLTEAAMQRLWDAPVAWHDRIFPAIEPWQRALVFDKHALVEHMATRGIAIPRHRRVDAAFDREVAAHELGLPLVLKGSTGCNGRRVRIVDTLAALDVALRRAHSLGGEWIVQEYIASPTSLVGGLFRDGAPLRVYAAEKLSQYPSHVGGAIQLRSTHDGALVELGLRVIRELRWTGFASADLVRRPDGSYVLLEVNPRLWGSCAAAAEADVDLFAPYVQLLAGESPRADLEFADGVDSWIFPKYFRSTEHRNVQGAVRAIRELVGDPGRDWLDPRFAIYAWRRARGMRRLIEAL